MTNEKLIAQLTVAYTTSEGVVKVEELDKRVLKVGAWVTIAFKAMNMTTKEVNIYVNRYQKSGGVYEKKSSLIIQDNKQAYQLVCCLADWTDLAKGEAEASQEAK